MHTSVVEIVSAINPSEETRPQFNRFRLVFGFSSIGSNVYLAILTRVRAERPPDICLDGVILARYCDVVPTKVDGDMRQSMQRGAVHFTHFATIAAIRARGVQDCVAYEGRKHGVREVGMQPGGVAGKRLGGEKGAIGGGYTCRCGFDVPLRCARWVERMSGQGAFVEIFVETAEHDFAGRSPQIVVVSW